MLHHLRMIVFPLLHFCLYVVAWLPSLIVFANFGLLFDLCLSHSTTHPWEKKIATYLNPYNSCLFRFNSSQIFVTNSESII
jgi:hypothetical protein